MIIYVFNTILEVIGLIEDYYSLTWAERYYVCGDFELELPITYDGSPLLDFGNFLYIASSDTIMIIEDVKPSSDKNSTNLVVQGESAESLLKRRVLLEPYSIIGNSEQLIYDLMSEHVTSLAANIHRRITIFNTTFPTVSLTATFAEQLDMITIYDIVVIICKQSEYGFKVVKENDKLAFSVYEGADRSYDQTTNPHVIFSDDFDNVIASSFYLSTKGKVNLVRVVSETSYGFPVQFSVWPIDEAPSPSNLDRFETFLITDVDPDRDDGVPLTNPEIEEILYTRARAIIKDKKTVGVFEGEFDIQGNFKYGVDFFMGDIVQCNLEGRNVKARVIELVRSYSTEGETSYVAMDFIDYTII